jgi:hypothetical protein
MELVVNTTEIRSDDPKCFEMMTVAKLEEILLKPVDHNRLHCPGFCRIPKNNGYYHKHCKYLSPDWGKAIQIAKSMLVDSSILNEWGTFRRDSVRIEALWQAGVDACTGEAAALFLNEPIALNGTASFHNGRHRLTAICDAGLSEEMIPIIIYPLPTYSREV